MRFFQACRRVLSLGVRFLHISYLEARAEHQSTRIGVLWIPLQTLIFTAMLALVFRHAETYTPAQFFLYVLSGYVMWQFIQNTVNNSVDIIQKKLEFAIHNNLDLAGIFIKLLIDRLFEFLINLAVLVVAVLILGPPFGWQGVVLFPALLATMMLTSLAVSYLVNIVTIYVPDFASLIRTATRFVFFASPIFWAAGEQTDVRRFLVQYNPVAHYLSVMRQVFGIEPVSPLSWMVCLALSALLVLVAALVFRGTQSFVRNLK